MSRKMDSSGFSEETVLVTGGTGSIGRAIVRNLLDHDAERVLIFSRDEWKQHHMRREFQSDRLEFKIGDVRDWARVECVIRETQCDTIFHVAAMKYLPICEQFPLEAVKTNVHGTWNVVNAAKALGVKRLVTVSTDKAVSTSCVMGATKQIAEAITIRAGYSCVRLGNVWGSRGSVIPTIIEDMERRKEILVSDPDVTRFVMRISEAANLIMLASRKGSGKEIFILKMRAFRLGDLVSLVVSNYSSRFGLNPNAVRIKILGLQPGEKVHEDLATTSEARRMKDIGDMYVVSSADDSLYKRFPPVKMRQYSSDGVRLLRKKDLCCLVDEFLTQNE